MHCQLPFISALSGQSIVLPAWPGKIFGKLFVVSLLFTSLQYSAAVLAEPVLVTPDRRVAQNALLDSEPLEIGPHLEAATPEEMGPKNDEAGKPAKNEKILEAYNRGVELFKIAQTHANKGNPGAQERVLKEAVNYFNEALKAKPDFIEAQSNVGFAWLTLKKNKQAIDAFKKALAINEQHLNSLNGIATAYALNNQVEESIVRFQQLTTLAPNVADYYFNYGSVLQKAGRLPEAETAYIQALKASPNHQRALFNLGTLKENQNQLETALDYYNRAKGSDIGNQIGLESLKRIEAIEQAMNPSQSPPEPSKKKRS